MGLVYYWGSRDYRRALDEFGTALQGLPNDAELWSFIGFVHRRLGSRNEAIAAFEKGTRLAPRDANLFLNLGGHTFRMVHRYAEAVRAYDRAASLAPELRMPVVWKGRTYVAWQGQLDTLRTVLRHLPADAEPTGLGTGAALRAQVLLWERNADGMLQFLRTARAGILDRFEFYSPASLYAAWAHQLLGNRTAARAAFDSARVLLDSVIRDDPDHWPAHAARGLALAGLGRRDEALRETDRLQRSPVYREDVYEGALLAEGRARIFAQAGEANAALDEIERLLAMPSGLSIHMLRLDPRWDPIRELPRFKALR
jgi:serine/threonine-protein kinase